MSTKTLTVPTYSTRTAFPMTLGPIVRATVGGTCAATGARYESYDDVRHDADGKTYSVRALKEWDFRVGTSNMAASAFQAGITRAQVDAALDGGAFVVALGRFGIQRSMVAVAGSSAEVRVNGHHCMSRNKFWTLYGQHAVAFSIRK